MENTNQPKVDLDGINPVPISHRTMSPMDYAMVFWSSTIVVQIMVVGQYLLVPIGKLNFLQVIGVGIVSSIILSFCMTYNGIPGMKYGIPFIIQARPGFGVKGAKVIAFIRSVPAICWNGIGCWIGAMSLDAVTQQIFGFGNLWVYFFLILFLQSFLAYKGIKSIKWFDSMMSIVIFAMLIYFFYVVLAAGKIDFAKALQVKGDWGFAFWAGVMAATANYTTVILNSSDIMRHINPGSDEKIKSASAFASFVGIIPPWMFMVLSGMLIGLATGAKDPIEGLVQLSPNPVFGIILLIFIILAQVTSNLTLNILPPALAIQDMFGLSWKNGVVIVGFLSVVTAPWLLFSSDYFFLFQNIYSCFLGPGLGVLIANYYFIKKQKLNVDLLYGKGNVYEYANGYSPAGMIALIVGAILSFIFLNYSWFVGFPSSMIIYTVLKKLGIEKKYEEIEAKYEAELA